MCVCLDPLSHLSSHLCTHICTSKNTHHQKTNGRLKTHQTDGRVVLEPLQHGGMVWLLSHSFPDVSQSIQEVMRLISQRWPERWSRDLSPIAWTTFSFLWHLFSSFCTELSDLSYVSDLLLTRLIVQFTVLTTYFKKNSNKITCLDRLLSI